MNNQILTSRKKQQKPLRPIQEHPHQHTSRKTTPPQNHRPSTPSTLDPPSPSHDANQSNPHPLASTTATAGRIGQSPKDLQNLEHLQLITGFAPENTSERGLWTAPQS